MLVEEILMIGQCSIEVSFNFDIQQDQNIKLFNLLIHCRVRYCPDLRRKLKRFCSSLNIFYNRVFDLSCLEINDLNDRDGF